MSNFQIKNSLQDGINLDYDNLRLPPETALFLKNVIQSYQTNTALPSLAGGQQVLKPLEGNVELPLTLPDGNNYCIGTHYEDQTNALYFFLWNSADNHSVWKIFGDSGTASKIYEGALLPFTNNPQNFLTKGRVCVELKNYYDRLNNVETNFEFLIFTTNDEYQCFLSVYDSIATNSYSTSFFTATAAFYNHIELIHLTLATPMTAIGLNSPNSYTPQAQDAYLQNLLIRQGWQFRLKFVDVFGRPSIHGIISSNYITIITSGCAAEANGLPRCLNLNFDAGNPLVAQIVVEYRVWKGDDRSGALATGWFEYDTIFKYDNSSTQPWYNRPLNPLFTTSGSGMTYDSGTNFITYTFCADKGNIPIDNEETAITSPSTPITSAVVAPIKN